MRRFSRELNELEISATLKNGDVKSCNIKKAFNL